MKNVIKISSVCGAVLALSLGAREAQAVVIDPFNGFHSASIIGPPIGAASASTFLSSGSILGGERDILLERTSGNQGSVNLDVDGSEAGAMSYASGSSTAGRATIQWDGIDGSNTLNPVGLGSVDMTDGGATSGFGGNFASDLGGTLLFRVYSNATDFSVGSIAIPSLGATSPQIPFFVSFASFAVGGGAGADFTNVSALEMIIDGTARPSTDVVVDLLRTTNAVPEPGSVALMLGAMTSGAVLLRRRRK